MKGSHINPFYENSLLCRKYHKDFTSLAFVVSGKYQNLITFLNVQLFSRVILSGHNYNIYNTSGASETIRIKFFSLSSLSTGPKIRVPTGSFSLIRITSAFSPQGLYLPSLRRISFLVRTITAFTPSPLFTVPPGDAALTEHAIRSPILAYRFLESPSTLIHITLLAPLLSATLTMDCV